MFPKHKGGCTRKRLRKKNSKQSTQFKKNNTPKYPHTSGTLHLNTSAIKVEDISP